MGEIAVNSKLNKDHPPVNQVTISTAQEPTSVPTTETTTRVPPSENVPSSTIKEKSMGLNLSKGKSSMPSSATEPTSRNWKKFKADAKAAMTLEQRVEFLENAQEDSKTEFSNLYQIFKKEKKLREDLAGKLEKVKKSGDYNYSKYLDLEKSVAAQEEAREADYQIYTTEFERIKKSLADPNFKSQRQTAASRMVSSSLPTPGAQSATPALNSLQSEKVLYTSTDMYNKYAEGYEDAVITLARRGLIGEEVFYDKFILPPDFKRTSELWYAINAAKKTYMRDGRDHSYSHDGKNRGNH